eukprot:9988191-Heterocapsa_arctica.AAC.1
MLAACAAARISRRTIVACLRPLCALDDFLFRWSATSEVLRAVDATLVPGNGVTRISLHGETPRLLGLA